MQYISFREIEILYKQKRCEILKEMSSNLDPIVYLNTALLDNGDDARDIKIKCDIIEFQNKKYRLVNAADSIRNKSRLKIVYLLSFLEPSDKTAILIDQANKLAARGHDVLIYSHNPKPYEIGCSAYCIPVHQDSNLSDVTAGGDIVLASCWHMAADALNVAAPLKYIFVHEDPDILQFDTLDEYTKQAVNTAFSLPFRILAASNEVEGLLKNLFARKSILIQTPDKIEKSDQQTVNKKNKASNSYIKKIEAEFKSSSKSTIQAIKIISI